MNSGIEIGEGWKLEKNIGFYFVIG